MAMPVAACRFIVGKDVAAIPRHNADFKNLVLVQDELAEVIRLGWAFCAQHRGTRRAANVTQTGFLAVDIDEGLRIEDAEADPFFQAYASILYPTVSHTPEAHRFRIVFELEVPLTSIADIELGLTGLSARFGGDQACTDAGRIFCSNPGCIPTVYGNVLPAAEVSKLIAQAGERTASKQYRAKIGLSTRVRSRLRVPVDIHVKTSTGRVASLWELTPGTRVFCPNHVDTRPSAFIVQSSAGKPGISCSTCLVTLFPEGTEPAATNEYMALDLGALVRNYTFKELAE